jgi:hypothetical protein
MKATYISPKTHIYKIAPETIICVSFDTNNRKTGNASTMAASREYDSSWDDEE